MVRDVMKLKRDKRGMLPVLFGIVGVVLVVFLVLAITPVYGLKGATSLTPKSPSCESPTLQAEFFGKFYVEDGAFIGVEPRVQKVDSVGVSARPLALFEPFDYEVVLYDHRTGKELDSIKGNAELSSAEKTKDIPFSLFYNIPDNNCDGVVDDSQLRLKITIEETKDISKDKDVLEQVYTIKNGRVQ